jgi:hypothetical protein
MSECKAYRREIEEAADGGALSPGVRAHAALCRACGGELRRGESLRALVGGLGKVEAPADFEFRLRARMAAAKSGGERGRFGGRWLYGFAPVAVAACFVVVSATLYFRQAVRPATNGAHAVAVAPAWNAEPERAPSVNDEQHGRAGLTVAGGRVAQASRTDEVVALRTQKSARQSGARGRQTREVALKAEGRTGLAPRTIEISVTGAPVITGIPVKASAEPLRMILRDERGAERVVPMRSVSFGSQDFLSRGGAARPAATEVGGVW